MVDSDEFRLTCVLGWAVLCHYRFWVVLSDGYSDTVTVNVGSDSFGGYPRWSLKMPENRYLRWHDKPSDYAICEQTDYNNLFLLLRSCSYPSLLSSTRSISVWVISTTRSWRALELTTRVQHLRRGRLRLHPHREGEGHPQGRQRERRPAQRPCRRQPVRRGRQRHPGRRRRRRRPGLRRRERHRPVSGPCVRAQRDSRRNRERRRLRRERQGRGELRERRGLERRRQGRRLRQREQALRKRRE